MGVVALVERDAVAVNGHTPALDLLAAKGVEFADGDSRADLRADRREDLPGRLIGLSESIDLLRRLSGSDPGVDAFPPSASPVMRNEYS